MAPRLRPPDVSAGLQKLGSRGSPETVVILDLLGNLFFPLLFSLSVLAEFGGWERCYIAGNVVISDIWGDLFCCFDSSIYSIAVSDPLADFLGFCLSLCVFARSGGWKCGPTAGVVVVPGLLGNLFFCVYSIFYSIILSDALGDPFLFCFSRRVLARGACAESLTIAIPDLLDFLIILFIII